MPIMLPFDLWGAAFKDSVSKQAIRWHRAPLFSSFSLKVSHCPRAKGWTGQWWGHRGRGWGQGREGGQKVKGGCLVGVGAEWSTSPSFSTSREAVWRALKRNVCQNGPANITQSHCSIQETIKLQVTYLTSYTIAQSTSLLSGNFKLCIYVYKYV